MKQTNRGLPFLDVALLDKIFNCVYQSPTDNMDEQTRDFINMLKCVQSYNFQYRQAQLQQLFPLVDAILGPFEINSDGTSFWLALILAIQEIYGMRDKALQDMLRRISVRL